MDRMEKARAVLARHFGYADFRPGQSEAVAAALGGRDALVLMPTGGGKSLCYQVPSQVLPGVTLVVSPLNSLMKDQVDNLKSAGIAATFVNSTLEQREITARLAAVAAGQVKLLYIAPERFDSSSFRRTIATFAISLLTIDEAHCVSAWGHDFRPSYSRLGALRGELKAPILALTASATPEVRRDVMAMLRLQDPIVIARGFDRPNLHWSVVVTDSEWDKDRKFVRLMRDQLGQGTALAYAATRKRVEALSDLLNAKGLKSVAYHGGMSARDRHLLQEKFIASTAGIVVATNAFGMGIDKPDVRLVLHYDYPASMEAYYQEAGRAGRDRQAARCVILYGVDDHHTHEFLLEQAHPSAQVVRAVYDVLITHPAACQAESQTLSALTRFVATRAQAEASLRILQQLGVLEVARGQPGAAWLRLVVQPGRLRRSEEAGAVCAIGKLEQKHGASALYRGLAVEWTLMGKGSEREALGKAFQKLAGAGLIEWKPGKPVLTQRIARAPQPSDWRAIDQRRRLETIRLERMRAYATTTACRRAFLLGYFGDGLEQPCAGCDNCARTA